MLPKVQRSAEGCSACKIVLKAKKSAQKVLSAIAKGLLDSPSLLTGAEFSCLICLMSCLESRFSEFVCQQIGGYVTHTVLQEGVSVVIPGHCVTYKMRRLLK